MPSDDKLKQLLNLRAMGLHILCGPPRTKHPDTPWKNAPGMTAEEIVRRYAACPDSSWYLVTGRYPDGRSLLAIDLDVPSEGGHSADGVKTFSELVERFDSVPQTAVSRTGSGGYHGLFWLPSDCDDRSLTGGFTGIDILCRGHIEVIPPSIHPNGRPYEWLPGLAPWEAGVAEADSTVLAIVGVLRRMAAAGRSAGHAPVLVPAGKVGRGARNDTAFRYACRLRAFGLRGDDLMNAVAGFNVLRCEPPMDDAEVERIVASALRYEPDDDEISAVTGIPSLAPEGGDR